ncbi:MAG TPA: phosphoribosyltransferase [Nitrospiraceae bacterium]|nr:phosphoribosyltransferase [Nitrospiraceae bacterium]
MTEKVQCEYVSWGRFYSLSRSLTRKVYTSGFKPDIIVAIGRGGYMPARILSDFLHIMNLTTLKIEHYRGTQKSTTARIRYPLAGDVSGEKVLLVDDVCDTGDTFALASKHLQDHMQPREVRTAVLHYKKTSCFIPDYYASRMVKWRWIIYPWAAAEDISQFIRQMQPVPGNAGKICTILNEEHGIRISASLIKDILDSL